MVSFNLLRFFSFFYRICRNIEGFDTMTERDVGGYLGGGYGGRYCMLNEG